MAVFKFTTPEQLRDMLKNYEGFSWGSMKSKTLLPINKKSRIDKTPAVQVFGEAGITAIGTKHLGVGYDYRTSVLNKREKTEYVNEPENWEPHSLPFGQWYEGSKVIIVHTLKDETKPTYYMRVTYNSANSKNNKSELYLDNGKIPLSKELKARLHEFQAPKKPSKPAEENSQGLEDEDKIEVRTFKLESILELNFGGDTFIRE